MKEVKESHYNNGQLEYRYNYLNNKPHGLAKWWWNNGQLWYRANFLNGKPHGLSEWWRSNGEQWEKHYKLL